MQNNSMECQYVRVKIPRCTICGGGISGFRLSLYK